MKLKIKNIALALCLSFGTLHASVADYQAIYQEEQKEFNQEMSAKIKKLSLPLQKKYRNFTGRSIISLYG